MHGLAAALQQQQITQELLNKVISMPEFDRQLVRYPKIDLLLETLVGTD